jgi:hypothetical protein
VIGNSIPSEILGPRTLSGRIKSDSGQPAVRGRGGTTDVRLIWQELGLTDDE